ncbi:MAG TPA: energy transducer TonB [Acidobacteriaceae bacterium]|nr:energy transducer TonB [Acidobacteriaceae bacterium]
MKRTLAPAAVLCLASLLPRSIPAQQTASTPPSLPKDPVALLQLAWQQNGLHGADLQPWHVHATWTDVDDKGQATSTGTWEEWWAGENKYKIRYISGSFQQSLFVTDHGAFATGSADAPNWEFELIQDAVISPVPDPQRLLKSSWHENRQKRGVVEITCARQFALPPLPSLGASDSGDQYCFADELPVLRVYVRDDEEISTDSLIRFQGRYLARKIRILQAGLPETDIALDEIERMPSVADADFAPSPGAMPATAVLIPRSAFVDKRASGKQPEYPDEAKARRMSGIVLLEVTIRADGSVTDVHALTGPPLLQQSAVKAVSTWRYQPYQIAGTPVGVRTRIRIIYRLSG